MTERQILRVGEETFVSSESVCEPLATVFEDDSETGYFYALDLRQEERIVAAVHIYTVENVTDRHRDSEVEIFWPADGWK